MLGIGTNVALQVDAMPGLCAGTMCFVGFLPLIINLLIGYWMYKDAEKRNENGILWFIIGFFLSLIGLIIWMVIRPDMSEVRQEQQQQQQQWQQQPQQQQQPAGTQQQRPPQQQTQQPPGQQQQNACPDCGSQMRYVDEHDRWYCDSCQEYK